MNTFAVLLTGVGRGAIACVLVDGPESVDLVARRFRTAKGRQPELIPGKPCFGCWHWQGYQEELVVCRTDEQRIELHCHGGQLASRKVLDSLVEAGAKERSLTQWLSYSETDPFVRSAKALLPRAATQRAVSVLLDQVRGALRSELQRLVTLLAQQDLTDARAVVERLAADSEVAKHVVEPFSVVLVGRPNAGKSSLVNAIVGYQRALVFDQPGTTRDLVSVNTVIDGWQITFTDTAGFRPAENTIEARGIQLAEQIASAADLTLRVQDLSDHSMGTPIPSGHNVLSVGTKLDLLAATDARPTVDIETSSKTGVGIAELISCVSAKLVPCAPQPGAAVALTEHDRLFLSSIRRLLDDGDIQAAMEATTRQLA